MDDPFLIYVDRLKGGQIHSISGAFSPEVFEVEESDLQFLHPVEVSGEAYVSDDHLVIHLNGKTKAAMPCSVCNEMIPTEVVAKEYYHTEPLSEIRGAIFNFKEQFREAFLTELPLYVECGNGNCPERSALIPFMRANKEKETAEKEVHYPFSDL